jgi:hypothetical protein
MSLFKRTIRPADQPLNESVSMQTPSSQHRVDKSLRLKRFSVMRDSTHTAIPPHHHSSSSTKPSKLQRSFTSLGQAAAMVAGAGVGAGAATSGPTGPRRSSGTTRATRPVSSLAVSYMQIDQDDHDAVVGGRFPPAARLLPHTSNTPSTPPLTPSLAPSPIVTLAVGKEGRIFAAHEDVLCQAPFFETVRQESALNGGGPSLAGFTSPSAAPPLANSPRLVLPDEDPSIFSAVLEYLYKGDYYPRLVHNRARRAWELEDSAASPATTPDLATAAAASPLLNNPPPSTPQSRSSRPRSSSTAGAAGGAVFTPRAVEPTVFLPVEGAEILRDTVIYCAADRYGLEPLKRLALRKQGLQCGIDVATILRSAQYAYRHTPDTDSRLRAHYLALIIRCRRAFKHSGTMQAEMERAAGGSKLFFDLFVAMCNHLDDVIDAGNRGGKAF